VRQVGSAGETGVPPHRTFARLDDVRNAAVAQRSGWSRCSSQPVFGWCCRSGCRATRRCGGDGHLGAPRVGMLARAISIAWPAPAALTDQPRGVRVTLGQRRADGILGGGRRIASLTSACTLLRRGGRCHRALAGEIAEPVADLDHQLLGLLAPDAFTVERVAISRWWMLRAARSGQGRQNRQRQPWPDAARASRMRKTARSEPLSKPYRAQRLAHHSSVWSVTGSPLGGIRSSTPAVPSPHSPRRRRCRSRAYPLPAP